MGELLTLESAKQIAAYKAVNEYVKVILLLNKLWYNNRLYKFISILLFKFCVQPFYRITVSLELVVDLQ